MRNSTKTRLASIREYTNAKPGRWPKKDPAPLPLPGFDSVQVTQQDIDRWLLAVPKIDPASPRAAAYVRSYNVAAKIAKAKAAGQFERILDGRLAHSLGCLKTLDALFPPDQ